MDAITPIEDRRLILQAELDAAKSAKERNILGQFATPTGLASDVLAYACTLMLPDAPVRFLDPAIGTGSFYGALLREFRDRPIDAAAGFEIDPHYGKPARKLWHDYPLDMQLADFTTAKPPGKGRGYNLIICNPPYVRHHHMDKEAKARLLAATAAASGVQMAGLAGLYCYFLGLSHAWMEADGLAGWLIPSEFMDVNYGVPVKRYLLNQVELIRIHRFDPSELQFGDALVSSAVVWFRKRKPAAGHQVEFSYGGTLANPKLSRTMPLSALQGAAKWSSLAADGVRAITDGLRLIDFFGHQTRPRYRRQQLLHPDTRANRGTRSADGISQANLAQRPASRNRHYRDRSRRDAQTLPPTVYAGLPTARGRGQSTLSEALDIPANRKGNGRRNLSVQSPHPLVCPRKPATRAVYLHLHGSQYDKAGQAFSVYPEQVEGNGCERISPSLSEARPCKSTCQQSGARSEGMGISKQH